MKKTTHNPDMLDEYDFSKGVRGKYAKRYAEGTNVVVIDPDIVEYFPDHDSVNDSLRKKNLSTPNLKNFITSRSL